MSFAREVQGRVMERYKAVAADLDGRQRERMAEALYRLGFYKQAQLMDPATGKSYQADIDSALLSVASIAAETAFDVERAVNEAVAEVVGVALGAAFKLVV